MGHIFRQRNLLFCGEDDKYEISCRVPAWTVLHWLWHHEHLLKSGDWRTRTESKRRVKRLHGVGDRSERRMYITRQEMPIEEHGFDSRRTFLGS